MADIDAAMTIRNDTQRLSISAPVASATAAPDAAPVSSEDRERRPITLGVVAIVLLLSALWGGTAVSIKVGLRDLPALGLAGFRFGIGLTLVYLWTRARRVPIRLQPGELAPILLLTVIFALQIATFNWGTRLTLAGRSTLILNSYPLFVLLMAHTLIPGDRLSPAKAAGAVCAFAGVAVVFSESLGTRSGVLLGDGIVLFSAIVLATQVVVVTRLVQRIEPNRLLLWQMVLSLPLFFGGSALSGEMAHYRISLPGLLAVLYQGVLVAGVCFLVWTTLLKHYSPSRLSIVFFTTPLFGIIAGHYILGEPISAHLGAGGILVALGIALAQRGR
jgi:drug/metabolite transporter (DMT)-like permease